MRRNVEAGKTYVVQTITSDTQSRTAPSMQFLCSVFDGNDGSRQRPDATVNSHVLPAHPSLSWASATPGKRKLSRALTDNE